jgi:acyl dehydratase
MAVDASKKGKSYPPVGYEVGREKIREYSRAIGATAPENHEREAAREKGYRDVVAPPMFAVVYSAMSVAAGVLDPEVGINFARMLHGSQEFVWGEPVCSGDTIITTTTLADLYERGGMEFYVFESVSVNQDGQETVRGTWTNIVRGG